MKIGRYIKRTSGGTLSLSKMEKIWKEVSQLKQIFASGTELTKTRVKKDITEAKKEGYKIIEYIADPFIGSYLTIELKDFDSKGKEL